MNEREQRFCEEYLVDLDAKNAALRAGFSFGVASKAANWIKPKAPGKPALRREIDRLMAERSRRTGVSADRVVEELARVAFANVMDVLDEDTMQLRGDVDRNDAAAVARIKCKQTANGLEMEIQMHDKYRALELLGKHLGMFAENVRLQQMVPVIVDDVCGQTRE